jgi:hypothetical protein
MLMPGADGEPAPEGGLWRKGLVYTTRTGRLRSWHSGDGYRISAGFKRSGPAGSAAAGFRDVYRRVTDVAKYRVSQLTCPDTGKAPGAIILGHAWGPLGANIRTSLITVSVRCSDQNGSGEMGEPPPTDEALGCPGGATLEDLERLAPQRADEIYNEFDFTDRATRESAPITLSYGERIEGAEPVTDFAPFVERAESVARSYHGLLQAWGEAGGRPFRIRRREWFPASQFFVTVHICFHA